MRIRFKFSKKQLAQLPALQTKARIEANLVLFRRVTAIQMLALKLTQTEIAATLGVCREVISRWLAQFLAKGALGLRPNKSPGRKSKLSKDQKALLKQQIQSGPQECGYPGGVWTSSMIQEHIQNQFGVFYAIKYIPQMLKNMGLSHIKPKYTFTLSRDELKKQIQWIRKTLPDLYQQVKACDGVLLFQDETTCQLQPNIMATWALKGQPPTEEKNSRRGSLKVFGTIELFSGKLLYSIHDSNKKKKRQDKSDKKKNNMTSKVFAQFLRQVSNHYKGREVFMVIDGASYHGGEFVNKFLSKNKQMHLIRQPVKSPNLNPIEKVWKELKKDRIHNMYFQDEKALMSALRKGLHALQENPSRVRSLTAKWEEVVEHPELAVLGSYDSSLIPKKYQNEIDSIREELLNEEYNRLQSNKKSKAA